MSSITSLMAQNVPLMSVTWSKLLESFIAKLTEKN
jgi:hypothetical protein